MFDFNFVLPAMGEGIIEATITKWFVEEGNKIAEDEAVVEVATDKVDSEVPSPVNGTIKKILFKEGDTVKIGDIIAVIETMDENKKTITIPDQNIEKFVKEEKNDLLKETATNVTKKHINYKKNQSQVKTKNQYISPLVKNIAQSLGLSHDEILTLTGTGKDGRITKNDIHDYIRAGRPNIEQMTNINPSEEKQILNKEIQEININNMPLINGELVKMDRIRKIIAENMLRSKKIAPHVTVFHEIDVTNLVNWRNKFKDQLLINENLKLTYTPIFVEAVAKSLKDFPVINSSVVDDKILLKKDINIGIATALENGNLIVPVIKNADKENLRGLAIKINTLVENARSGNLKPVDIQDSTFSITNLGQFESITGTPIIHQPEVGILAIGAIKKKPSVVNENNILGIAIRDILMLSLTFDHRIIDGSVGGKFLKSIGNYLENFDVNRTL